MASEDQFKFTDDVKEYCHCDLDNNVLTINGNKMNIGRNGFRKLMAYMNPKLIIREDEDAARIKAKEFFEWIDMKNPFIVDESINVSPKNKEKHKRLSGIINALRKTKVGV